MGGIELDLQLTSDRADVYNEIGARHPNTAIIVPPRSNAMRSNAAAAAPTQRNKHLQIIAKCGRMNWQKLSGYCDRALVKAYLSRYKRTIRDALQSQKDARQNTEVAVAVGVSTEPDSGGRPPRICAHCATTSQRGGFHAFALRSTQHDRQGQQPPHARQGQRTAAASRIRHRPQPRRPFDPPAMRRRVLLMICKPQPIARNALSHPRRSAKHVPYRHEMLRRADRAEI